MNQLIIESKDQIYKLIDQNEELKTNKLLIPFMDSMKSHYWGCRCNEALYDKQSTDEYQKLNNLDVIVLLNNFFNVESTTFM